MKSRQTTYNRALEIVEDICIGCSHCMKVCPTEALRVSAGKAGIHADWCIDCGECYRVCPTRAIRVMDDDFKQIFNYKYRVLLVPSVFFAQFKDSIPRETIYNIIGELGFTEVCAVEQSVDTLVGEINEYLKTCEKPAISSFCPAVIRLIQVRFPSLVDNIMKLLPPIEITAQYYKRRFEQSGVDEGEYGIFYLTPCIAKIAAVKSPVGGYTSPITGVINMDFFFNKVYLAYKQRVPITTSIIINGELSSIGVLFPSTGGESSNINGKTLAIDGMKNVIDFLELLENEEIPDVDFLEIRACDESCAGGILSHRNRFLTAESLRKYSTKVPEAHNLIDEYKRTCSAVVHMDKIEPRSMVKYDKNIELAIKKMESARRLKTILPGIDCGACGAPSCEALAEDIVRDQANVNSCIFLRTIFEKRGEISLEDTIKIMEDIWGKERFDKSEE
ncbi:MAG: [Fe-Fe] hydrogenase large subunit C-terminal domain-containing protein [Thermodesulfovibrionia bacterium]|nr:[Fe-Fe] hydrogenase large subunit C-terminal domain-containing protein [Thermodesulfovibrionia bacterium]